VALPPPASAQPPAVASAVPPAPASAQPPAGSHGAPTPGEVAEYYDRNTRRFLLVGRSGGSYAIHRQLWGAGVSTPAQASAHINDLVAEEIRSLGVASPREILDLGCGVGGTLFHLGALFPETRLRGITISPRQVEIAARLAARLGLASRCSVVLGDFTAMTPAGATRSPGVGSGGADPGPADAEAPADVAVAVESFVHARDRDAFLASAAGQLSPGGLLLVVDDFLAMEEGALTPSMQAAVQRFREGWRVPGLCTPGALQRSAAAAGLIRVRSRDLTPLVRPGRIRDRVIRVLVPLFRGAGLGRGPFFGNMMGGDALQRGIQGGGIQYRMEIFRRGEAPG
jgi:cyclopropane fatty-acyl-phospholipid synthase-like methyltransferase